MHGSFIRAQLSYDSALPASYFDGGEYTDAERLEAVLSEVRQRFNTVHLLDDCEVKVQDHGELGMSLTTMVCHFDWGTRKIAADFHAAVAAALLRAR